VADGGGLENRYGVTPIVGSNPTPSASDLRFSCALDGNGRRTVRSGSHAWLYSPSVTPLLKGSNETLRPMSTSVVERKRPASVL
jgi:hypothetical protein